MDFKEEDFPLYQLLVKRGGPGAEYAIADFERARTGGDDEKYGFALGLQTVALSSGIEAVLPGMTREIKEKTLRSCLAVFEDVASRGHAGAVFMVQYFKRNGLGGPKKIDSIWKKKPPTF
jgi:hypothetical protein